MPRRTITTSAALSALGDGAPADARGRVEALAQRHNTELLNALELEQRAEEDRARMEQAARSHSAEEHQDLIRRFSQDREQSKAKVRTLLDRQDRQMAQLLQSMGVSVQHQQQ